MIELKSCPSCEMDAVEYKEHKDKCSSAGPLEVYMPEVYRDRLTGEWVVECRNCGMSVLFHVSNEEETAAEWNALPR